MSKIYEKFASLLASNNFFWTFFISAIVIFLSYNAFNVFSWIQNKLSLWGLFVNFSISWLIYFIFLLIVFYFHFYFYEKKQDIQKHKIA